MSVEVIDLRTLRPIDVETVLASVRKTNRIVVVEEGPLTGGWAGEVLACVTEQALGHLDDAWRIATPNTPIPYSPPLEDAFLPGADRIVAEIRRRSTVRTVVHSAERSFEASKVGSRLRQERERRGIEPPRACAPRRRLAEPRLADRARPRQPVGEHALRARHRARDDDERRLRRRRRRQPRSAGQTPTATTASLDAPRDPARDQPRLRSALGAPDAPQRPRRRVPLRRSIRSAQSRVREDALSTHGGREYGYVTSGTLGVRVGFEEYELGPGGSIAFDSSSPHRLWTIGASPSTRSGSSSAGRPTRAPRRGRPADPS